MSEVEYLHGVEEMEEVGDLFEWNGPNVLAESIHCKAVNIHHRGRNTCTESSDNEVIIQSKEHVGDKLGK